MSLNDDMAADIAGGHVFFDIESGFAENATTAGGGVVPVVFDLEYYESDTGELTIGSRAPRCWIRDTDQPAIGGTLTIRSVDYAITHAEPNGDGESYLYLQKVLNSSPTVIDSFVVTVGAFSTFIYGFSTQGAPIGSSNPATVDMAGGTTCLTATAQWGFSIITLSVDDQDGALSNTDNSAFKQMAIVDGVSDAIVLERSAATSYSENGFGIHTWQWSGQASNPYGTVIGATRTIELRS